MKSKNFYDHRAADLYLTNSIIRLGDRAVYVTGANKEEMTVLHLPYLRGGRKNKQETISVTDHRIDMTPIPLGFVNNSLMSYDVEDNPVHHLVVCATSRTAVRQFKIGLSKSNFKISPWHHRTDLNYTSEQVTDMYHNKYPSITEAIKKVKLAAKKMPNRVHYMAFSKSFCVDSRGNLWNMFIETPIGTVSLTGSVRLKARYTMFKDQFKEIANG